MDHLGIDATLQISHLILAMGVVKVDGEFHAPRNQCPHDSGPVCKGRVEPRLVGEWGGSGERVEQHYDDDQ